VRTTSRQCLDENQRLLRQVAELKEEHEKSLQARDRCAELTQELGVVQKERDLLAANSKTPEGIEAIPKTQALSRQLAEVKWQMRTLQEENDRLLNETKNKRKVDLDREIAHNQVEAESQARQVAEAEASRLRELIESETNARNAQEEEIKQSQTKQNPDVELYMQRRRVDIETTLAETDGAQDLLKIPFAATDLMHTQGSLISCEPTTCTEAATFCDISALQDEGDSTSSPRATQLLNKPVGVFGHVMRFGR